MAGDLGVILESFLYAVNAVLPIVLIIALGYVVRRVGFGDDVFFKKLNKLCFRALLPVQLFNNIIGVKNITDINWALVGCCLVGFTLCFGVGVLCIHFFVPRRDQKGVVLQAAFRSNQAVIGLPLCEALGGAQAVAVSSVLTAVFIPIYNVLAIIELTFFSSKERASVKTLLKSISRNPLIIGVLSGLLVVLLRRWCPGCVDFWQENFSRFSFLQDTITSISRVASPMMLIALGARFDFKAMREIRGKLILGSVLRLIVAPVFGLGLAIALRNVLAVTASDLAGLIALFASPVAISSSVMVQEIGGDEQLAGQLVVWSSVFCTFTLILLVFILHTVGLL